MSLKKDGFGSRSRWMRYDCDSTTAVHCAWVTGKAPIKNEASVTWCCGPSFGCRSGSSDGEPMVKLPAGIETISSPAPKPSASVNIAAEYFLTLCASPFRRHFQHQS